MRACGPRWSGPGAGKEGMSMLFKRRKVVHAALEERMEDPRDL